MAAPRPRVGDLVCVRIAAIALALFLLQLIPLLAFVGLLPLHLLVGAFVAPLLELALLAMLVEAVIGRMPRFFALVPLVACGAYYAAVLNQRFVIVPRIEAELAAKNSATIPFDPAAEIIEDSTGLAGDEMVVAYRLPILLESGVNPLSSVEPAPPASCKREDQGKLRNPAYIFTAQAGRIYCVKRTYTETPDARPRLIIDMPLTVVERGDVIEYNDVYSFTRDGVLVGTFTQSNLGVLSWWPYFTVGCGLLDLPFGWHCGMQFHRDIIPTDGIRLPPTRGSSPSVLKLDVDQVRIAAMLGLVPRDEAELASLAVAR